MKSDYPIRALCDAFEVSSSGYYDWANRAVHPGSRALANRKLTDQIRLIHHQSRLTYGSPRVMHQLRKQGSRHGRNRIARIMRQEGICGRQKARHRVQTTNSNHHHPIAPNRLAEAPSPTAPNQTWVADITYIQTRQGWLYLAAVLDLYSRRIVGWAMCERIDTALVLKALSMALLHRDHPKGLLFHSDRGVQYASGDFRTALSQASLIPSMSRKGNCYDNASMESFWSTLKLELIYRHDYPTLSTARLQIFDYIESFYNRTRIHSSINHLSPVDFEALNN